MEIFYIFSQSLKTSGYFFCIPLYLTVQCDVWAVPFLTLTVLAITVAYTCVSVKCFLVKTFPKVTLFLVWV